MEIDFYDNFKFKFKSNYIPYTVDRKFTINVYPKSVSCGFCQEQFTVYFSLRWTDKSK